MAPALSIGIRRKNSPNCRRRARRDTKRKGDICILVWSDA